MRDLARALIGLGAIAMIGGFVLLALGRTGLGRLPGDFVFRRGGFVLYLPLMTSILLSIALSLLFWLMRR